MYILQDELKLNEWQFSQRKYLPYEIKVKLAEARIREWYEMRYRLYFLTQDWNFQKLYGTHVRQVVTM